MSPGRPKFEGAWACAWACRVCLPCFPETESLESRLQMSLLRRKEDTVQQSSLYCSPTVCETILRHGVPSLLPRLPLPGLRNWRVPEVPWLLRSLPLSDQVGAPFLGPSASWRADDMLLHCSILLAALHLAPQHARACITCREGPDGWPAALSPRMYFFLGAWQRARQHKRGRQVAP